MFKLIWLFFRIGAMNEVQYRAGAGLQPYHDTGGMVTSRIARRDGRLYPDGRLDQFNNSA